MSEYAFEPIQSSVSVAGSTRLFPVHRIYCVGKNYAAHTRELGGDPDNEPPCFFLKPADCVTENGASIAYPPRTTNLHHEIELVVAIGKTGIDIKASQAHEHIFGYAVGLDLTRRDLQNQAKEKRRPWESSKSFEQAAPITAVHTVDDVGHPSSGLIWLAVNGDVRQDGDIADMVWNVPDTIAELSTLFTLAAGDLIFTGTPAGVAAINKGDQISGGVDGVDEISVKIS